MPVTHGQLGGPSDEALATAHHDSVTSEVFERWYRAYAPQLFAYAARRVGTVHAEDICALTFTDAWARMGEFDPERGSPASWLFGIATNLIRRHHRTEKRQMRAFARTGVDPVEDGTDGLIGRLSAELGFDEVARALLRVRKVDRDLFWLWATSDLSYAELAHVTGVPTGTVRSRLARTRQRLRAAMGPTPRAEWNVARRSPEPECELELPR